jgi:hypothetical protein
LFLVSFLTLLVLLALPARLAFSPSSHCATLLQISQYPLARQLRSLVIFYPLVLTHSCSFTLLPPGFFGTAGHTHSRALLPPSHRLAFSCPRILARSEPYPFTLLPSSRALLLSCSLTGPSLASHTFIPSMLLSTSVLDLISCCWKLNYSTGFTADSCVSKWQLRVYWQCLPNPPTRAHQQCNNALEVTKVADVYDYRMNISFHSVVWTM